MLPQSFESSSWISDIASKQNMMLHALGLYMLATNNQILKKRFGIEMPLHKFAS